MKTEKHPVLNASITFDKVFHSYVDDAGVTYTSVTEFVKKYFKPFDEEATAKRMAKEKGCLEIELLSEWRRKREAAAEYGTRVHAYAEALVIGSDALPSPATDKERRAFEIVDAAVTMLEKQYEFIAAEQIVFDPLFLIAGTIDLVARNRETGALAILDWKTCKNITDDNYGKFALSPIQHVYDSDVSHHALQLSIYTWMLTDPEYSVYATAGDPVELALIHIPHIGNDPVWRPMPYLANEVKAMLVPPKGNNGNPSKPRG